MLTGATRHPTAAAVLYHATRSNLRSYQYGTTLRHCLNHDIPKILIEGWQHRQTSRRKQFDSFGAFNLPNPPYPTRRTQRPRLLQQRRHEILLIRTCKSEGCVGQRANGIYKRQKILLPGNPTQVKHMPGSRRTIKVSIEINTIGNLNNRRKRQATTLKVPKFLRTGQM